MNKPPTRRLNYPFYVNEEVEVHTFTTVIDGSKKPNSKVLNLLPRLAREYRVGFGVIVKQGKPGKSIEAIVNDAATLRIDRTKLNEGFEIYAGCFPGYTDRIALYDDDLEFLQQVAGVVYGN